MSPRQSNTKINGKNDATLEYFRNNPLNLRKASMTGKGSNQDQNSPNTLKLRNNQSPNPNNEKKGLNS